jgi:predicted metal-dependent hydrolase
MIEAGGDRYADGVDRRARKSLMERIRRDALPLAQSFGLHYRAIEAERGNVTSRYGVCFSDGTIRIRLNHATTREPLKYSSLVNTLCHELAHLRHFDHGPGFRRFYYEILEYARDQGIYRPRRARAEARGAAQLSLFAEEAGARTE